MSTNLGQVIIPYNNWLALILYQYSYKESHTETSLQNNSHLFPNSFCVVHGIMSKSTVKTFCVYFVLFFCTKSHIDGASLSKNDKSVLLISSGLLVPITLKVLTSQI